VLEHLRDVGDAVRAVRRVLAPGGIAYVEVPDALTFADWPNAPYQDFSTEHINFFSPLSLRNLMMTHGFAPVFSEQNSREQSYRTIMSNVSAVFRREDGTAPRALVPDELTRQGLERYIAACQTVEDWLHETIARLADEQRPIIVWGVGTHTGRLMATSRLGTANIVAFVDSNTRYQERALHGRPIISPEALRSRPEAILISSRVFQREIEEQIREGLGLKNEILTLYAVDP
jgi:hypothetical protein